MRPDNLPDSERHAHGTRARYVSLKCRCADCRAANTAYYYTMKARGAVVDAEPARLHIVMLSEHGIGYRKVAALAKIGHTLLRRIIAGTKTTIRSQRAASILGVTVKDFADSALVDGKPTWRALRAIMDLGFTKTEIAERLHGTNKLQIRRKRVLARTERAVLELHETIKQEMKRDRALINLCLDCGLSHAKEDRQKMLDRLLPLRYMEVSEIYPCIYPPTNTGLQLYTRDCIDLGKWTYPRQALRAGRIAANQARKAA